MVTGPQPKSESQYEVFDFNAELKKEKLSNSIEFPFTNVHVEDSLFLVDPPGTQPLSNCIIALECVFFMTDCQYLSLEKKNFGSGVPKFEESLKDRLFKDGKNEKLTDEEKKKLLQKYMSM